MFGLTSKKNPQTNVKTLSRYPTCQIIINKDKMNLQKHKQASRNQRLSHWSVVVTSNCASLFQIQWCHFHIVMHITTTFVLTHRCLNLNMLGICDKFYISKASMYIMCVCVCVCTLPPSLPHHYPPAVQSRSCPHHSWVSTVVVVVSPSL